MPAEVWGNGWISDWALGVVELGKGICLLGLWWFAECPGIVPIFESAIARRVSSFVVIFNVTKYWTWVYILKAVYLFFFFDGWF